MQLSSNKFGTILKMYLIIFLCLYLFSIACVRTILKRSLKYRIKIEKYKMTNIFLVFPFYFHQNNTYLCKKMYTIKIRIKYYRNRRLSLNAFATNVPCTYFNFGARVFPNSSNFRHFQSVNSVIMFGEDYPSEIVVFKLKDFARPIGHVCTRLTSQKI